MTTAKPTVTADLRKALDHLYSAAAAPSPATDIEAAISAMERAMITIQTARCQAQVALDEF